MWSFYSRCRGCLASRLTIVDSVDGDVDRGRWSCGSVAGEDVLSIAKGVSGITKRSWEGGSLGERRSLYEVTQQGRTSAAGCANWVAPVKGRA